MSNVANSQKNVSPGAGVRWAFFGSSNFSVIVLNKLETLGIAPQLVVTTPDKAKGRGLKVESGPVKEWAEKRNIPVFAPASLRTGAHSPGAADELKKLGDWDVFLVASYGKIVPSEIFNIPKRETLNIHPSLLPKFRGPTPLESAILTEKTLGAETSDGKMTAGKPEHETGVTIMKIDAEVDHGPIVTQKVVLSHGWPPYYKNLEVVMAEEGAELFSEILSDWIARKIEAKEQNHSEATFTKKFEKSDLLLDLSQSPEVSLRKIRAFSENRGAFFLTKHGEKEIRVIVTKAKIENGTLLLEKVKPEGKKEMAYEDFKRGLKS